MFSHSESQAKLRHIGEPTNAVMRSMIWSWLAKWNRIALDQTLPFGERKSATDKATAILYSAVNGGIIDGRREFCQ